MLYVIQYMLSEISLNDEAMGKIEMTGVYDIPTVNAVRRFKRRNLMDDNPLLDVMTLNRIFDEYEASISDIW